MRYIKNHCFNHLSIYLSIHLSIHLSMQCRRDQRERAGREKGGSREGEGQGMEGEARSEGGREKRGMEGEGREGDIPGDSGRRATVAVRGRGSELPTGKILLWILTSCEGKSIQIIPILFPWTEPRSPKFPIGWIFHWRSYTRLVSSVHRPQ